MHISAIKTSLFKAGQDIQTFVDAHLPPLEERSVLVLSSKLLSLAQNRLLPMPTTSEEFSEIVAQESTYLLPENLSATTNTDFPIIPTVTHHNFFLNAGIDKSNSNGSLILLPTNIFEALESLWHFLRKRHSLDQLGIILTDTHCLPLRAGVVGTCLGWYGFKALEPLKGQKDLYGNPLRVTQVNVADSLAVASDYTLGQSGQCTPMALVQKACPITFTNVAPSLAEQEEFFIPNNLDLYGALLKEGLCL